MPTDAPFDLAIKNYADLGIDVDAAFDQLSRMPLSIHCWQADDVGGFETTEANLSGSGLAATGNYPGKARTVEELRQDYEKAFSLIPGTKRANIHAMYGDFSAGRVDRDAISIDQFQGWVDWAKDLGIMLDFNATMFGHSKAASGFTLSDKDPAVREFWIDHVSRCREISAEIGKQLGGVCLHNLWLPDGCKDSPVDRAGYRKNLIESLDRIYATKLDPDLVKDSVEGKLFGIGSESFVVGSQELYFGYAITRGLLLTMDMGHFHPTESVADKISAILPYASGLLLHVSRGVRWDSDHVVIENDEMVAVAQEIVRARALDRVFLSLDYFDASINRIGAWVIGARATLKSVLYALLEPWQALLELEESGKLFQRLAMLEELKAMPFGAIWDEYCARAGVPAGRDWIGDIEDYEANVLRMRN
jgi:L-rhamnose isomerase